ncbi:hypothetical protein D3C74_333920 [compost metagenome]
MQLSDDHVLEWSRQPGIRWRHQQTDRQLPWLELYLLFLCLLREHPIAVFSIQTTVEIIGRSYLYLSILIFSNDNHILKPIAKRDSRQLLLRLISTRQSVSAQINFTLTWIKIFAQIETNIHICLIVRYTKTFDASGR